MFKQFIGAKLATMAAALLALTVSQAAAAVINPTGVTVTVPTGAAAPTVNTTTGVRTYRDDVLLESLVFGSGTISGAASFSAVKRFQVLTGRSQINAEFGDLDTAADGDANPFVKAGVIQPNQTVTNTIQESTDPANQDAALLNVFNSRSLSEMSDGEGGAFSFKLLFANGLRDSNWKALDSTPELVFAERGGNAPSIQIQAITGGTFESPIYSELFTFNSTQFWKSPIHVDTREINAGQTIAFGGIDFNDLKLGQNAVVYGLRVFSGEADFNGIFLASADPMRFVPALDAPPVAPVPVPASLPLLLGAVGGLALLRRKRA